MEQWKDIKDYEGLYQVSNMGRIRSLDRLVKGGYGCQKLIKGKIIKPYEAPSGYYKLSLYSHRKREMVYVHKTVAENWLPNPDNLPCINHKDENKKNNSVDNLEWCSYSYNNTYNGKQKITAEKTSKAVYQYSLSGELIKEWKSTMDIQRSTGYLNGNIGKACRGKYKQAYGFKWSYK